MLLSLPGHCVLQLHALGVLSMKRLWGVFFFEVPNFGLKLQASRERQIKRSRLQWPPCTINNLIRIS